MKDKKIKRKRRNSMKDKTKRIIVWTILFIILITSGIAMLARFY